MGSAERRCRRLSPAGTLTGADLSPVQGAACQVDGSRITVAGTCVFRVASTGGAFALTDVVRRAKLIATTGPVDVAATVQGHDITSHVDAGKSVTLTVGKDGGRLVLACRAPTPPGCVVTLSKDTP